MLSPSSRPAPWAPGHLTSVGTILLLTSARTPLLPGSRRPQVPQYVWQQRLSLGQRTLVSVAPARQCVDRRQDALLSSVRHRFVNLRVSHPISGVQGNTIYKQE
jgi:hypothetical protein